MKILLAGLGEWGASWLTVIDQSPFWELAGVVDADPQRLKSIATSGGVAAYESIDAAIDFNRSAATADRFDAVVIVVPPEFHAAVAIPAIEAGIPTLIEKPLTHTLEDAVQIVRAAERSQTIAMVSQNYRFKRAPRTVQRLISSGIIGDVQQVFINYHKNPPFTGFRLTMDEPLIVDAMIHHLDQIRGIVGIEPHRVRATSWNPSWSQYSGNASAVVQTRGAKGEMVVYTGSWTSQGRHTTWDGTWDIQGTRGAILWDDNQIEVRFKSLFDTVFLPGALEKSGVMVVDLDPLAEEERLGTLRMLAESITEQTTPETDVRDNLLSLNFALATAASARTDGSEIELPSLEQLATSNNDRSTQDRSQ